MKRLVRESGPAADGLEAGMEPGSEYDQETARNNGQTSFLRLMTTAKLHTDQTMITRNFKSPERRLWKEEQSPIVKKEGKPA